MLHARIHTCKFCNMIKIYILQCNCVYLFLGNILQFLIIKPKLTLWKDHTCSRWTSKLCKWKNRAGGSWRLLDFRTACRHFEGEVFHGWRYCSTWICRQAVIQSHFLLSSTHHQVQEMGPFTTNDQQEILQMIQALLGTYGIWPTSCSCWCVVPNIALPGQQQENWCQYSTTAYTFPSQNK